MTQLIIATSWQQLLTKQRFNKITEYIEIGKGEGRLVAGGTADDSVGYFVQPTVFADVEPSARIMKEEIFGPVVAIAKAKDFDHAIEIANDTEYGLTGAVITTNRMNLEKHVKNSM